MAKDSVTLTMFLASTQRKRTLVDECFHHSAELLFFYPVRCILFDFFSCFLLTCIFVLVLGMSIGNESAPTQLAQCWFPGLAISNAKI